METAMTPMKCPTCGKAFQAEESTAKPFCSNRCRQIDLGRWLDEKQTLPAFPSIDEVERKNAQGDSPAD
jgi:endogenous inhibitor of DNA gyrase (YacG/DUF329 family)